MKPPFDLKPGANPQLEIYASGVRALEVGELIHQTMTEPSNFGTPDTMDILEQIKASSMLLRKNAGINGINGKAFELCGFKVICSDALPDDMMIVGKQVFRMLRDDGACKTCNGSGEAS